MWIRLWILWRGVILGDYPLLMYQRTENWRSLDHGYTFAGWLKVRQRAKRRKIRQEAGGL